MKEPEENINHVKFLLEQCEDKVKEMAEAKKDPFHQTIREPSYDIKVRK